MAGCLLALLALHPARNEPPQPTIAIAFNKPKGVIATNKDQLRRSTIFDKLVPELPPYYQTINWRAVGRLDQNTTGLILVTNDGWLVHQVSNPTTKAPIPKTYRARVARLDEAAIEMLRDGVDLGGGLGRSSPAQVELERNVGTCSWLRITLHEGKNRQVRRMLHAVGSSVIELERIAIGGLTLESLDSCAGSWRLLCDREIEEYFGYSPKVNVFQDFHSSTRKTARKEAKNKKDSASASPSCAVAIESREHASEITDKRVRVNKALRASHSRRGADRLIASGRVRVNGEIASLGDVLESGDTVMLDGIQVDWERLNVDVGKRDRERFAYLKLWKRRGVVCTTDLRQRGNIIDDVGPIPNFEDRIFPIGRLDADSSGLILLTSDGNIVNRLLRASGRKQKEYIVTTNMPATRAQIAQLASGVVITTVAQRDGRSKPLTAPTRPCVVERHGGVHQLRFVLEEGRNRQIRRMCDAVGLQVVSLHRTSFAGIDLSGCDSPGEWCFLRGWELDMLGID